MKIAYLIALSVAFVGCRGGSSSGGDSKTEFVFSDSSVTRFEQTGGIAKIQPSFFEKALFSKAYAASGNVSCLGSEAVSFQADALGNTVDIETTCKSSEMLELEIRQHLLESLDGHKLRRTMFGLNAQPCGGSSPCLIDFTGGFVWGQPYEIEANTGCHEQYTFYADGRVVIDHSTLGGDTSNCDSGYPETMPFRFHESNMEFDSKKQFNGPDADYERWCLDDDEDGNCD